MSEKRLTRKQARAWLAPIRACFGQIKSGEVDAVRGYAVTRLHASDDYARIDFCIAGFRGLLARLVPTLDIGPLLSVERKLANGVPLTIQEIDAAFRLLRECEGHLVGLPRQVLIGAVQTEQIVIEMESLGIKEAA
jgi:hypothetical protein